MNEEEYLEKVRKIFKGNIEFYKVNSEGCGNLVLEINNEWIFRFSRSELDIKQLELEKAFLLKLETLSPIPVPSIKYSGTDFIGYKKLHGVPLTQEIFEQLWNKKESICKSIGNFLKVLHSTEFSHKNLVEYPLWDDDFWNKIWKNAEPYINKQTKQRAFGYFTDYFGNESNYLIEKNICHWDFHPNHIIYNEEQGIISWIIDFGRLGIYDPAIDFNLIERFYGEDILDLILVNYNNVPENFKKRITFQKIRRMFWMISYATKIWQEESIPRYIKRVEDLFSN